MKRFAALSLITLFSTAAHSHAEHDKARYVAPDGVDAGRCELVAKPCKTIAYAATKSNKGDKILVAEGQFVIEDVNELFYLTSKLVPVYGSYSKNDHFKTPNKDKHATYLLGVPGEYKQELEALGFHVVSDGKALSKAKVQRLRKKLSQYAQLDQVQSDVPCTDGKAEGFDCNNVDLVAHIPLSTLGAGGAGNDIWGHVDLNTGDEYAIIGLESGAAVVSLKDPENPTVVGTISGLSTTWRDIKTYQFFDHTTGNWHALAYVSTDGANDSVDIIDLSDLPNSIRDLGKTTSDSSLHNIYVSNVNYSTGVAINGRTPLLHSMGSNRYGGAHRSYSLENPISLEAVYSPTSASRADYTHDGTSFVVTDDRVATDCQRSGEECDVFVDFNENEMRIWDQTDGSTISELGQGIYDNAEYTHSGWWTEDKKYVYVHDELDEMRLNENTSVIIFDVTELKNPVYKSRWVGTTKSIDHNGFVRGNRYYMSNYEKGLTILDITDPISPIEVGNFDTFPVNNNSAFNGAWGVYPFLPSGLILVSDINSGLYVLKENTKMVEQGQLQFAEVDVTADEGTTATITVNRIDGSKGAISVEYQSLWASATGDDFESVKGTLEWADGDTSAKTISINVLTDDNDDEFAEKFSVELFNVQGGATLYSPGMVWINIPGKEAIAPKTLESAGSNANEDDSEQEPTPSPKKSSSGFLSTGLYLIGLSLTLVGLRRRKGLAKQ